jgi:hypothetical protein
MHDAPLMSAPKSHQESRGRTGEGENVNIDVTFFVLPEELDIDAARRFVEAEDVEQLRFVDGLDALDYAVSPSSSDRDDGESERATTVAAHAGRWIEAFAVLAGGGDPFFEDRFANRMRLRDGRELLAVGFDLDGAQDPWYEEVWSLASAHYADVARAMGVLLSDDFDLEVQVKRT